MGWLPLVKAAPSSLKTGLISFWEFENTAWTDAAGSNNLTGNGSPTSVTGLVGNAVNLVSASSQFLSHTNNASLQFAGGIFSIQAWVNWPTPQGQTLISKNDGGFANKEFSLGSNFTSSNVWSWNLYATGTSGSQFCNSSVTVASGWTHIVCTWDGTTQLIYINGISSGTNTPPLSGVNTTSTFMIGKDGDGGSFSDVKIDQTGLWNKTLTSVEVSQLYNSGVGLAYSAM